jgi:hypothetical protein
MTNWSTKVTKESNALILESGVFTWSDPKRIAKSLAKSARNRKNKKVSPLMSSMSMLNFYINRAGKNLSASRLRILNRAKIELRRLYT